MATDTMFLRLVGGNAANQQLVDEKIGAHVFIAMLQMWHDGEITKANVVAAGDFTHADDSNDLDLLKQWFLAAKAVGLEEKFASVLERRMMLGRIKRVIGGGQDMDGKFGYAVKSVFIGGSDGAHSLKDTGNIAERFTTWAA